MENFRTTEFSLGKIYTGKNEHLIGFVPLLYSSNCKNTRRSYFENSLEEIVVL